MAKQKKHLPEFETEEEEAAFWDEHDPTEFFPEHEFRPLETRTLKDKGITVRLDTETRKRLDQMAAAYRMGPSTLIRHIVQDALDRWQHNGRTAADPSRLYGTGGGQNAGFLP